LSPHLLTKAQILKCIKTKLPAVLYGCEPWSLTLREEYRLAVFENSLLKRKKDIRGRKQYEDGGNYIMRTFIICTLHTVILGKVEMGEACRPHTGDEKCIQKEETYVYMEG
jgi:hypothetical protein